jgi:hypothetical protein
MFDPPPLPMIASAHGTSMGSVALSFEKRGAMTLTTSRRQRKRCQNTVVGRRSSSMNNPSDRNDMTPARRNAHDAFKETSLDLPLTDYEMAQKAIDLKRRRLATIFPLCVFPIEERVSSMAAGVVSF